MRRIEINEHLLWLNMLLFWSVCSFAGTILPEKLARPCIRACLYDTHKCLLSLLFLIHCRITCFFFFRWRNSCCWFASRTVLCFVDSWDSPATWYAPEAAEGSGAEGAGWSLATDQLVLYTMMSSAMFQDRLPTKNSFLFSRHLICIWWSDGVLFSFSSLSSLWLAFCEVQAAPKLPAAAGPGTRVNVQVWSQSGVIRRTVRLLLGNHWVSF